MQAASVLGLGAEEMVRRMNAFIGKRPNIWLERDRSGALRFCERQITSPRAMRSGKVVGIDLDDLRPDLFHEISSYSPNPSEVISIAATKGFFSPAKPASQAPRDPSRSAAQTRIERLHRLLDELPEEKLGLLERVLDKFKRYPARDLAHGYQHFSLSVSKH
jgi:hypothetical protein